MVSVNIVIQMAASIQVHGRMTNVMARANLKKLMEIIINASLKMIYAKDKS